MAYKMLFDSGKCQGYANCLIEASEIWDFDEDNDLAVLKQEFPSEDLRGKAEASARCCPSGAIAIEDVPE